MTPIGKYLIEQTHKEMDTRKRMASGESVQSLREEVYSGGIKIFGVDYWKEINEGTPAGTRVNLNDIVEWKSNKERRYGLSLPPAMAIVKSIIKNGAPKDVTGLQITDKVLNRVKSELDKLVKTYTNKMIGL